MAANTIPITPLEPAAAPWNSAATLAANTAMDGTGTVQNFFTAGANGSRVNRVRIVHKGTNVATVLRIFRNNGSTNTVAANNSLLHEVTIAANTISQVAASVFYDVALNVALAAGEVLFYTIGTAVAAGHSVTCPDAADY